MHRVLTLLIITAIGVSGVFAHGSNSHFAQTQDVTVKTTKVNGNVYMLRDAAATSEHWSGWKAS